MNDGISMEQELEALLLIENEMATDDLVEDSFIEALDYDACGYGIGDDISYDEVVVLDDNFDTIMDLCEIVAAVQKGFII